MYQDACYRGLGDGSVDVEDPFYNPSSDMSDWGQPVPPPDTIPLSSTPIGPSYYGPDYVPPPLVNYAPPGTTGTGTAKGPTGVSLTQAFKNPDGSATYDGTPYSPTDLLNPYNIAHLFGGFLTPTTPYPKAGLYTPNYAATTTAPLAGGISPTVVMLGAAALAAFILLGKRS